MASGLSYLDVSSWRNLGSRHLYRSVPIFKNYAFSLDSASNEDGGSLADLDLDDFIVAGAPFGGPIAITKDITKLTALKASGPAAFGRLTIFTASGTYLGSCTMHTCEGGGNSMSAAFGLGGSPRFLGMAWTSHETLGCVFEDGSVDLYDSRANYLAKSFSLLPALSRDRIDSFATCGGGMAAIVRRDPSQGGPSFSLVAVYDWSDPLPVTLHSAVAALEASGAAVPGLPDVFPTAIACIDGTYAADGRMEVLLGTPDRSIVVVESSDNAVDQQLDAILTAVVRMLAVSPSGRYLAAFGEDGSVTVTDTAFERKLVEFSTKAVTRPTQLAWCGEDAVAVTWPDRGVLMIGPSGDYLCYSYGPGGAPTLGVEADEAAAALEAMQLNAQAAASGVASNSSGFGPPQTMAMHVVQEMDGLRVIGPCFHELIQRVPACVVNVRSIGSTAPSATLMTANAKFESGDADCDELLRGLMAEDALTEAVSECIAAACAEWEPSNQQALLRGASYGKACDPDFDAAVFVDACKQLRLLNALRSHSGGMPLTLAQLEALTPSVVVDRLCARHAYKLALQICDYLGLQRDRERALVHWACAKVKYAKPTESDESLRDKIRKNLAPLSGPASSSSASAGGSSSGDAANAGPRTAVSYADIAAAADSAGRRRLATMLLSFEPRVADQVPILLKMREGPLALEKALESGDADLVHLALLHLRQLYVAKDRVAKAARDSAFASKRNRMGSNAGAPDLSNGLGDDDADDDGDDDESASMPGHEAFLKIVLAYPAAVDALASWYSHRYFASLQAAIERPSSSTGARGSRSSSFSSHGTGSFSMEKDRPKPQGRGLGSLLRLYKSAGRYCDAGRQLLTASAIFAPRPSAGHASHTSLVANNLCNSGSGGTQAAAFFSHPDQSLHISFLQKALAVFKEGEKAPLSSDTTKAAAQAIANGAVPVTASERSDCGFYRMATEEQLQLLLLQLDLDRDLDPNSLTAVPLTAAGSVVGVRPPPGTARFSFFGLPLVETIAALVRLSGGDVSSDAYKRVTLLKETFKLPDAAFWHVRVDALAAGRDWIALQRLSEEKRGGPPIGYKPFVDACMAANAPIEARKYASKISDYNEKMEALIASGGFTEAAEAATKAKDVDRLNQLGNLARTPAALEAVEKGLAALGAR